MSSWTETKVLIQNIDELKTIKCQETDAVDFLDSINSNIKMFVVWAFYICFYELKLYEKYLKALKEHD